MKRLKPIKTMNMRLATLYSFVILTCFSSITIATAQENRISLEAGKKAALAYSYDIQNAKLSLDEAKSIKRAAKALYAPQVELFGTGMYGFEDLIPASLAGVAIDNMYFTGVAVTEAIYAGGKRTVGNDLADLQLEVNRIRSKQTEDSILLVTEQKYWQLVRIQEQQQVLEATQDYLKGLQKQQEDLLSVGLISQNDMFTVRVELSNLMLQKNRLSNMRKIALLDFALYTGLNYDSTMVAGDSFSLEETPVLLAAQPKMQLSGNSNYQLLQKSVEAAKLQTKLEKGNRMPTVAVGFNGMSYGSFSGDLNGDFIPLVYGTVSIPISAWWGGEKEAVKQKVIHEQRAENNLRSMENNIKLGIMKSWYDLTDSHKKIEYAQQNFDLAQKNLKVNRDSYTSGLTGLTELLNAQRMFSQSRMELIAAFAEREEAEVYYLYLTNQMDMTAN